MNKNMNERRCKNNLRELILIWNKKNKTIDDYFEMKENHTPLKDFFNLGNVKIIYNMIDKRK